MAVSILFLTLCVMPLHAQQRWEPAAMPPCGDIAGVVISGDTIIAQATSSWRSEDGGVTWERFAQREDGPMYSAFGRIWMIDTDTLYVHDRAAGWLPVSTPFSSSRFMDVLVTGDTVLVASAMINDGNVWMSTDPSGHVWTALDNGLPDGLVLCVGSGSIGGRRTLFCGVGGKGVFELGPAGDWRPFITDVAFQSPAAFTQTGRGYLFIDFSGNALESTDAKVWRRVAVPSGYMVRDFAVDGATLCLATNAGLYLSTDGGLSWARHTMGMSHLVSTAVAISQGRVVVGSHPYGVFVTDDGGQQWRASDFVDPVYFSDVLEHNGNLLLGYWGSEAWFRRGAAGWERFSVPSEGLPVTSAARTLHSHQGNLFYYDGNRRTRLWRSDDDGASWALTDTLRLSWETAIASGGSVLYVTSEDGAVVTPDHGGTWNYRPAGIQIIYGNVAACPGHVYLANQNFLRHSTDAGLTWMQDTLGLEGARYRTLLATDSIVAVVRDGAGTGTYLKRHADPEYRRIEDGDYDPRGWFHALFADGVRLYGWGAGSGIFTGTSGPRGWERWTEGLPGDRCYSLVGIAGGKVYAQDTARILRSRSVIASSTTHVDALRPVENFKVDAWPLPASDVLHIRLRDRTNGARVIVSDILGRERLRAVLAAGEGSLRLGGLPRGVYMLSITSGSHMAIRLFTTE